MTYDPHQVYREQQHSESSPERLVLLAMNAAIYACNQGRRGLLIRCLEELLCGLDFERGGEIAVNLARLYEYLLHEAREGHIEEVRHHLRELKSTWEQAIAASPTAISSEEQLR